MLLDSLVAQASPLSASQLQDLKQLVGQLTPLQQAWVSGYLAASAASQTVASVQASAPNSLSLTVLYASQTGNAKAVAAAFKQAAQDRGVTVELQDIANYKTTQLVKERYLVIVTSTYGEGEPPESALAFYKFLFGKKAPKLDSLNFAVLGLGDSSYEFFCKTATDFSSQLKTLGAKESVLPALLDVDYTQEAKQWTDSTLSVLVKELQQGSCADAAISLTGQAEQSALYTKVSPFEAELLTSQKITGRHSTKDVRHLEIALEGSGLSYQPGDALGVYFINDASLVDRILNALSIAPDAPVTLAGESMSVQLALLEKLELTQSYPSFVEKYAQATAQSELETLVQDKAALRAFLEKHQCADVLLRYPAPLTAQQLVDALRKQQPRLYSIASSQAEVGDEVHLTVGVVRYDAFGSEHFGGASGFLSQRLAEGGRVRVFVEPNEHFRLPDDSAPVLMIGPGTGIAPFRAFLQERDQRGATGQNWLFFGNPHFTQDFLYQVELQDYLKRGVLSELDVAFSRDGAQKVYVQHKLLQKGAKVWAYLQQGAFVYICGDGAHMAKDVHQALFEIVQQHGGLSAEDAETYLDDLRAAKRYQKDVY